MLRLWAMGKSQHKRLTAAVVSAFIGVLLGMAPYFAAAQIIIGLIFGLTDPAFYLK